MCVGAEEQGHCWRKCGVNLCINSLNQRYSFIPRGLRRRGEERVGEGKGWDRTRGKGGVGRGKTV